jgi:cobalt-zinc-cadmium efflux system outer membrane protein
MQKQSVVDFFIAASFLFNRSFDRKLSRISGEPDWQAQENSIRRKRRLSERALCWAAVAVLLTSGCVRFHPKPLSPPQTLEDYEARRLDSPEITAFFASHPEVGPWPPPVWDLRALTLVALFYHPSLDVARAQWGVVQAGRITAGERPNPAASFLQGYNSTTPVSEITPWIPEAVLEIPIETAGKRGYRLAQARHLSEAARWNIVSVAWEVRSALRRAYIDVFAARQNEALLESLRSTQAEILRILEVQLEAGEAALYDVTQARIALDASRLAALDAAKQRAQAEVRLAGALGLPPRALPNVAISFEGLFEVRADLPSGEVRRRALLGRADILGLLSEYEASQSALQIEIAKQYPDLNIGAGYQLDQTDSKWTLSLGLVLPILNRNRGPIAEAEARRRETGARFLELQAKVIEEIDTAVAAARAAVDKARTAAELRDSLKTREAASRVRYELGEISKLELLSLQLELASSEIARLESVVDAQHAIGDLENAMQSPLELKDWLLAPPREPSPAEKEQKHE